MPRANAKTKPAAQPAPQAPVPTATPISTDNNAIPMPLQSAAAAPASPRSWPAHETADWAIDKLTPYARNPRLHSPEQIAQIAKAILHFGFTNRVLIDEDGTIIAGHGRVLAAELLKLDTVPVMIARGWSAEDRRAYVIWDNQSSLNASWDDPLLAAEVADLNLANYMLPLLGFGDEELGDLLRFGTPLDQMPNLSDADRAPFQQITFTLHDDQVAVVAKALKLAKSIRDVGEGSPNQNSNGNALAAICAAYIARIEVEQRKATALAKAATATP